MTCGKDLVSASEGVELGCLKIVCADGKVQKWLEERTDPESLPVQAWLSELLCSKAILRRAGNEKGEVFAVFIGILLTNSLGRN